LEIHDLRNIREMDLKLVPGLNVFQGRNAQGKTSLLEAVGLVARGRSFRTEETVSLIRRGAERLSAQATAVNEVGPTKLQVELALGARRLRVDGREVRPGHYYGRLEVSVYSTDRLRVVRGSMRDRRQHLDRGAAALWPSYRQALRDYERVLRQRNAALESGGTEIEPWNERFVELGATVRQRRAEYAERLMQAMDQELWPANEHYELVTEPAASSEPEQQAWLRRQIDERHNRERQARHSLVGPHRDRVRLNVNGDDAAAASSGQARSLLLALTLASVELYRRERGTPAVVLLDDLDSELDDQRARKLCEEVGKRAQALVTTAHPAWARGLTDVASVFEVTGGRVASA
jgi:DNA replication and repair protein RecF